MLPADVVPFTQDRLVELFESQLYVIDWCESEKVCEDEDRGYFVRPVVIGRGEKVYDPDWRGQCIFLTNEGCRLEFDKRPWNCRAVKPNAKPNGDLRCTIPALNLLLLTAEQMVALEWEPHWDLLHSAAKIVEGDRDA